MTAGLLTILGPTASGKSAVALELARQLGGEIVSCDAMQVYRGLDVGTAKPTAAERRAVPHHLLDILDLHEPYSAARFQSDADRAMRDILARGRQPILCGGTGLYARALLYGLALWPADPAVAAALRRDYAAGRSATLLAELAAAAPDLAARLAGNPRRWLRALEVLRLTGAPPAPAGAGPAPAYARPEIVLLPDPAEARRRVAARTAAMLAAGWVAEARRLRAAGLDATPTARQALGYRQVWQFLDGELASVAALATAIVTATCQYAKRQRTWFRHQHPRAIVVPVQAGDTVAGLAARVLATA